MILLALHIVGAALWFGTAATLPFWGNRMNRADNLDMVLGIADTVFLLKNIFIMGGLTLTLTTGALLTRQVGFPFFDFASYAWLGISQSLSLLIAFNSVTILVFMILGRSGRRSCYRLVPPFGYNNIGLIAIVYFEMALKPASEQQWRVAGLPLLCMATADVIYVSARMARRRRTMKLDPEGFAKRYFGFMNAEDMYGLLGLFHDDAFIVDSFAVGTVRGAKQIEAFFQFLGDQFDDIKMYPESVEGRADHMTVHWCAQGVTRNGLPMRDLRGTNVMRRRNGKISSMHIEFDLSAMPAIQLFHVKEAQPGAAGSSAGRLHSSQPSQEGS
jgi:uncharacterized membrane protein/ketosteroid isomerase-like protein